MAITRGSRPSPPPPHQLHLPLIVIELSCTSVITSALNFLTTLRSGSSSSDDSSSVRALGSVGGSIEENSCIGDSSWLSPFLLELNSLIASSWERHSEHRLSSSLT